MPLLQWEETVRWRQTVRRINCPILLLTGEPQRQAIVTPQVADQVRQLAAGAQVINFPGASHHIHQDQFTAYAAALRAFWNQLPPDRTESQAVDLPCAPGS